MAAGWLFVAALAVLVGSVRRAERATREEIDVLSERVRALKAVEMEMKPLERRVEALWARAEVYQSLPERRGFWREVLGALAACSGEGLFLLSSEPLMNEGRVEGIRVTFVSYLDEETEGVDVVKALRDDLRASSVFSEKTKIHSRPSRKRFARTFTLDARFEEPAP